jgi:hypothetical protein
MQVMDEATIPEALCTACLNQHFEPIITLAKAD